MIVSIEDLTPKQARMVGVVAEAKATEAQQFIHRNDAQEWDEIARKAHAAADEGFAVQ